MVLVTPIQTTKDPKKLVDFSKPICKNKELKRLFPKLSDPKEITK
jgi:hypothetical protein